MFRQERSLGKGETRSSNAQIRQEPLCDALSCPITIYMRSRRGGTEVGIPLHTTSCGLVMHADPLWTPRAAVPVHAPESRVRTCMPRRKWVSPPCSNHRRGTNERVRWVRRSSPGRRHLLQTNVGCALEKAWRRDYGAPPYRPTVPCLSFADAPSTSPHLRSFRFHTSTHLVFLFFTFCKS